MFIEPLPNIKKTLIETFLPPSSLLVFKSINTFQKMLLCSVLLIAYQNRLKVFILEDVCEYLDCTNTQNFNLIALLYEG
ncbi:hypothetical protein DB42_CC00040 [Neochlamydia sp. EPS4]|nr:hypothetical protein DB42_CC00040 [Neochlamydia sp. EPS4]